MTICSQLSSYDQQCRLLSLEEPLTFQNNNEDYRTAVLNLYIPKCIRLFFSLVNFFFLLYYNFPLYCKVKKYCIPNNPKITIFMQNVAIIYRQATRPSGKPQYVSQMVPQVLL